MLKKQGLPLGEKIFGINCRVVIREYSICISAKY